MKNLILVFVGGGVGSVLRFLVSKLPFDMDFPLATFIVNILGSFIIGFLSSNDIIKINSDVKLLLAVGVCGGLTTFSSFINENGQLISKELNYTSVIYISLSIIIGYFALVLGYRTGRFF
ncbi:MAG: fluoride efflux transporter CrcB [Candidatus Delongbacteria bacterium]|nr:fluoride efflux transporter CrcB [Candidatus Delongbacteria bacterium]MBN2834266.1 fluoride efflux transporter CrcB [Candidatus Delongbacteria bacterium]